MIIDSLYREIMDNMPLLTIDLVIVKDGKYLLIKRENEPSKGEFWTPGGRMLKGETIKEAAVRKAKEEVGLDCEFVRVVHLMEYFHPKSTFKGVSTHSVGPIVLMEWKAGEVKLDRDHSAFEWRGKIEADSHELLKENLLKAGFSE